MGRAQQILGADVTFPNRKRRAKRRALAILSAPSKQTRKPLYRDLLVVVEETLQFAERTVAVVDRASAGGSLTLPDRLAALGIRKELVHYTALARRVMGQTERRVFNDETVPAQEKVVSIFEEHTDIIVKDRRETLYGHKICLTSGKSTLVTDCTILDGNPADTAVVSGHEEARISDHESRAMA